MSQLIVFLDDGGVMNDNLLRGPQWRRLIGEYFIPLLGGTPEAWSEANLAFTDHCFEPDNWRARLRAATNFESFDRQYQLDWLGGMCEHMGIPIPPTEECIALARRATDWIIPRVQSAFPGAADAIRALRRQGYTLHTASGEPSTDLHGYLTGMGVRDCIDRLYGPDLIDVFKEGPQYYERIFADLGISPADALIVDDSASAIGWATQAGARTVHVTGQSQEPSEEATLRIASLAELPAKIHMLD